MYLFHPGITLIIKRPAIKARVLELLTLTFVFIATEGKWAISRNMAKNLIVSRKRDHLIETLKIPVAWAQLLFLCPGDQNFTDEAHKHYLQWSQLILFQTHAHCDKKALKTTERLIYYGPQ